jgi:hypothetical protein
MSSGRRIVCHLGSSTKRASGRHARRKNIRLPWPDLGILGPHAALLRLQGARIASSDDSDSSRSVSLFTTRQCCAELQLWRVRGPLRGVREFATLDLGLEADTRVGVSHVKSRVGFGESSSLKFLSGTDLGYFADTPASGRPNLSLLVSFGAAREENRSQVTRARLCEVPSPSHSARRR